MAAACAAIIAVLTIGVALKASGLSWPGDQSWTPGGDFAAFYVAGRILGEHGAVDLYNVGLQERVYREVVPGARSLNRTFAYPPYIAALFTPLAMLGVGPALTAFMLLTPLLFAAGLALLDARFGATARDERVLLFVAGLSFFPFIGYSWLGAQISSIGFAAVALALFEEDRGRWLTSGIVLSLCLYKPTLAVLFPPMLLIAGRVPQLAGFVVGAGLQVGVWLALGGTASMAAFIDELRWTAANTTSSNQLFNPYRYVDVNAFFRLAFGRSTTASMLIGASGLAIGAALVTVWVRARNADRPARLLMWAATITWTLVLNVYVPLYDTVLVVAAAALAVEAVRARGWQGWRRLAPILIAVYATPWIAEICARTLRIQIYTVALSTFGVWLLVESLRSTAASSASAPHA
jgi:hypothetical protein